MKFPIKELASLLQGQIVGNDKIVIDNLGTLGESTEGSITFLSNPKYENLIYTTKASAVIVKNDFIPSKDLSTTLIKVADPYSSFSVLLEEHDKMISYRKKGIEKPSYIGKNSRVGPGVYRGAFSYIGDNVSIGKNVKIYPHAHIGDNVEIKDNCIFHPGVKILQGVKIGNNCHFHAGAVVGSDGFGYAPQKDSTYKKIPQVGIIIIEDNVDVGANTVIDRATLNATIIKSGVKLDNLVQVAHNVVIGENSVMAGQSGIAGSSKMGKNCIVAGQVGISGHLEFADGVTFGPQAGVSKSVKKAGEVVIGTPAIKFSQFSRSIAIFKNLPSMNDRLMALEKKVNEIGED